MEALAKHVNELAVALGALTVALAGLAALVVRTYSQLRAARRDADAADAAARISSAAAEHHQTLTAATVESVDVALRALPPETARLVREKLRATQIDLGVQSDVARQVESVRKKSETPETGVKLPEGA